MRNEFLKNNKMSFGERLSDLMESKKIKNAPALAQAMYDSGILTYKEPSSDTSKKESVLQSARSINNHLQYQSADRLSGKWIQAYCSYFGCSADYLFGSIEKFTHEETDISKATGLTDGAVSSLLELKKYYDDSYGHFKEICNEDFFQVYVHDYVHTLSKLLEDPSFRKLLGMLSDIYGLKNYSSGESITAEEFVDICIKFHENYRGRGATIVKTDEKITGMLWEAEQLFTVIARRISGLPSIDNVN